MHGIGEGFIQVHCYIRLTACFDKVTSRVVGQNSQDKSPGTVVVLGLSGHLTFQKKYKKLRSEVDIVSPVSNDCNLQAGPKVIGPPLFFSFIHPFTAQELSFGRLREESLTQTLVSEMEFPLTTLLFQCCI